MRNEGCITDFISCSSRIDSQITATERFYLFTAMQLVLNTPHIVAAHSINEV